MDAFVSFSKGYLLPGSLMFLLLAASACAALLFGGRRAARLGRAGLAALCLAYWALSTPLAAGALEAALSLPDAPIARAAEAGGAQAVVVLGGGSATLRALGAQIDVLAESSALRALEGARLYRLLDDPLVVASGGAPGLPGRTVPESRPLAEMLAAQGVPAERIVVETASNSTREQALEVAPLLQARGIERFVLVTSPTHMRRALGAFRAVGLDPQPSPAPQRSEAGGGPVFLLGPNAGSLEASMRALREALALAYYFARGWLAAAPG